MSRLSRRRLMGLVAASSLTPFGPAFAEQWPPARVRLIVGTAPGGSPDVVGRLLAEKLSDRWSTSVYVDNQTQATGEVAYRTVARAVPDGSTIGIITSGFSGEVTLRPDPSYDPIAGFSFVTMLCGYPLVYAVPVNSPIASFPDLIARAKASPGKITYTITGYGSGYHLLTKWIELESGTSMTAVPYRGISAGVIDVLDGRVDLLVDAPTSVVPRVQAGQFRVLATSAPTRYALMPDAPTVSQTLPKVEFMSWLCLAAPPGLPQALLERLNADVKDVLQAPEFTKRLADLGSIPTPSSPDQTRLMVSREIAKWADVIKRGNIKVE